MRQKAEGTVVATTTRIAPPTKRPQRAPSPPNSPARGPIPQILHCPWRPRDGETHQSSPLLPPGGQEAGAGELDILFHGRRGIPSGFNTSGGGANV